MLQKHSVEGFDDFKAKAEELAKEDVPLYVYFSGSKTSDGKYISSTYLISSYIYDTFDSSILCIQ